MNGGDTSDETGQPAETLTNAADDNRGLDGTTRLAPDRHLLPSVS